MKAPTFHVSQRARALLRRILAQRPNEELFPGLIWLLDKSNPHGGYWSTGFYTKDQWDEAPPQWRLHIDGMDFLLTFETPYHLGLLEGACLDVDESDQRLFFRYRESRDDG